MKKSTKNSLLVYSYNYSQFSNTLNHNSYDVLRWYCKDTRYLISNGSGDLDNSYEATCLWYTNFTGNIEFS